MSLAHVCLGCGLDLARQRARKEPYYGLSLIVCPRCATASVRRKHPIAVRWRQVRRVDWALSILLVKLLCALAIAIATGFTIFAAMMLLARWPEIEPEFTAGWRVHAFELAMAAAWALVILPGIIGTWITAGMSHLTRRQAWTGWFAFMSVVIGGIAALIASGSSDEYGGYRFEPGAVENVREFAIAWAAFFSLGMLMLTWIVLCAIMGVPIGRVLLWLGSFNQSMRWRRRRRRLRRVRTAA
jgi:MFS family permease